MYGSDGRLAARVQRPRRRGLCPDCGRRFAAVARLRCSVCKQHHQKVPYCLVVDHPAVVAFYYERGGPLQYEDGASFQPRIALNVEAKHDQKLVSEDPLLVRVAVRHQGDALQLTIDEDLDVVEVREPA